LPARDAQAGSLSARQEMMAHVLGHEANVPPLPGLACQGLDAFPPLRGGLRYAVPPGLPAANNWGLKLQTIGIRSIKPAIEAAKN
jgi:hypothetical protein